MCEESNQVSRLSCEACSRRVRDPWVTGRSRIVGEVGKYYADITTRTIFSWCSVITTLPYKYFNIWYLLVQSKFSRGAQCVVEDCGERED